MRYFIVLWILLLSAGQAEADPLFGLPIGCNPGHDCFVQNYVDADPTPAASDFSCGSLTYDQHKGTDFRLLNYVQLDAGVSVVAAASGKVLRLRDGMADVNVREIGLDAIKDRMAGNSVIVDHGDGWVTQYAHMKKGSIRVVPGQDVEAGEVLGQVGLSGNTEFPHLHFEVRHKDQVVDPFSGESIGAGCGSVAASLWTKEVETALAYRPSGLLGSGFAIGKPDAEAARHGAYTNLQPGPESSAIVYWVDTFGLQGNDRLVLELTGPSGPLAANENLLPSSKAAFFAFAGIKRPESGWQSGQYHGSLRLERSGKVVLEDSAEFSMP